MMDYGLYYYKYNLLTYPIEYEVRKSLSSYKRINVAFKNLSIKRRKKISAQRNKLKQESHFQYKVFGVKLRNCRKKNYPDPFL